MRLLSHLVARQRAETDFDTVLTAEIERMRTVAPASIDAINGMIRLENDIFGPNAPYRGTIEIRGDADARPDVIALIAGLADRFGNRIHADLSTALFGADAVFVEPKRTPVRYQYLMRRNAEFSHASYLERYESIHSQFGLKTPGIHGYVQFHIEPESSRQLAASARVGVWQVDSVSELYLESVEAFLAALGSLDNDGGARQDEEIFVDRPRSHDFASRVDWQG